MKKKTKIIILLIIILVIIIKFDIFNNKKEILPSSIPPASITKEEEVKKPIIFSCDIPKKEYKDMSLLNIGQDTALSDTSYIPKDLKELSLISGIRKELCLIKEAKEAFELMAKDALKDKIKIKVSSAFRSYSTQKLLYENDLKTKKSETSDSVAKPGYSEHQLGTAIDITGGSINYTSASGNFNETIEDIWLKKNAYIYGFIQSYPSGKEDITGYKYEPWHYRYVGKEIAQKIKDLDLTITEFLNL